MGLFDFIFGKPKKIEDDFFGTMHFLGNKKEPQRGYFECRRHFNPADKITEIAITADESGPSQIQKDFFKHIEDNYAEISNSIIPLIEDEFRNWKEDFSITDFKKEFEVVYLQIPRCDSKPIIWEIAFESDHDRNHTFTVTMADLEAKEILIDG